MQEENRTFAELGIPFPLFDAPAKFARGYAGEIVCDLCQKTELGFELCIGDYIWETCNRCSARNGLPVTGDVTHATCYECRNLLLIPKFATGGPKACYDCVRAGKVCLSQDTRLGLISWEHVLSGVTNGIPIKPNTTFETIAMECGWFATRIPEKWMVELTRMPSYLAIQSEQWQFCCERPMVYIGEWGKADFDAHAPDGNGKRFFDAIVEHSEDYLWDAMWNGKLHDDFGIYVFHCPSCNRYWADWDMF